MVDFCPISEIRKSGREKSQRSVLVGNEIFFLSLQATIEMFRKRFGPILMASFGYFHFWVKSEAPPRNGILGPSATPKSLFLNSEAQSGGTTANQESPMHFAGTWDLPGHPPKKSGAAVRQF